MQVKAAASRKPDILALERLLERPDVPAATRGRIGDEIRTIRAGEAAERDAAYGIELYFGRSENWATIHDLRFEVDGLAAQICTDHADEFGGRVYCMRCQPEVRTRAERPLAVPDWPTVLARYRTPTRLRTVARQAPFIVVASGQDLRVSPDSSNRYRTLTRADFERAAPLLGRHGRAEVNEASRNSSYVEAILADFRRPVA